jgi:hypothetical protein
VCGGGAVQAYELAVVLREFVTRGCRRVACVAGSRRQPDGVTIVMACTVPRQTRRHAPLPTCTVLVRCSTNLVAPLLLRVVDEQESSRAPLRRRRC